MILAKIFKVSAESTSKEELAARLQKAEKEVKKWTKKLREAHEQGKSMSRRRRLRIELDGACEEKSKIKKMIEYKEGLDGI